MSSRKKASISRARKLAKEGNREIALERIQLLFKEAKARPEYANRYVQLARLINMKYKVPIPTQLKRKFCKKCYHYLVPGKNSKVRLKEGIRIVTCQDCGNLMCYPYRKKKSL